MFNRGGGGGGVFDISQKELDEESSLSQRKLLVKFPELQTKIDCLFFEGDFAFTFGRSS